jgi:ferredoxin
MAAKRRLTEQGNLQCDACFVACPTSKIPKENMLLIEERTSAWESAHNR